MMHGGMALDSLQCGSHGASSGLTASDGSVRRQHQPDIRGAAFSHLCFKRAAAPLQLHRTTTAPPFRNLSGTAG